MKSSPSLVAKYLVTIFVLALAVVLRIVIVPVIGEGVPFIIFYPAVVVCAWWGGLWPGIFATIISTLIAWYAFIPSYNSFSLSDSTAVARMTLFTTAGVLISLLGQSLQHTKERNRETLQSERLQRERFHVTLASIGDGVIATDRQGQITFINHVATSLTGWRTEEASGRPVEDVFKIVNEETLDVVANPALRAMKEGLIVGLANHTVLITKSDAQIPIDDSGAPIKDIAGNIIGAVLVFRDVSERRKSEQQRALLTNLVQSSNDAIVGKTLEGIITSWNNGAQRIFGYTAAEAIGKPITIIIPPDRLDEEKSVLERLNRGERIDHFETVRLTKDGKPVNISLTVSPIRDSSGRITGASKIARDITAQKQAEEERALLLQREQAARSEAEAANRMKDEFLANVSHELRGPLNAILGWMQFLRTGALNSAGTAKAMETIEQSVRIQSRLIDDLLDVSRITNGQIHLNLEPVNLAQIIEYSLEAQKPAAQAKSIRTAAKLDGADVYVMGDAYRLQQVISNLVSNAVKFTQNGGQVEVILESSDSVAQIHVRDNGKGITPELLPQLFERFRQGKDTKKYGGLGLGLAIVRHLVEMHGGSVEAQSPGENQGATFTIRLPVKTT